jgi:poly(beta-D-mannuronate) lyase
MIHRSVLALVVASAGMLSAAEIAVKDVAEFDAAMKVAKPGDAIVLTDGEWRDAKLVVRGRGEKGNPIIVRPQTPGKVALVGASTLRIGGKYLTVRDLLWKDCEAESEVIAFRIDSKNLAESCVLESCAVLGDLPAKGDRKWVSIYGRDNAVISCRFEEKRSAGTLLVVWLDESRPKNDHGINLNFFGARRRLGKNGGEIIRIGDSKTSLLESGTSVNGNYFYRCDGEAEIISNKSCDNIYAGNVFVGCGGALTLRHGNDCAVFRNAFFGDGRKGTGGVRVIGEKHSVDANLFHALEGDETRAAVSLMNGIPDSPANGYLQVKNASITNNTFVDCKQSLLVGLSDEDQKNQTLEPVDCLFDGNLVLTQNRPVFTMLVADKAVHGVNLFHGGELGIEGLSNSERWRLLNARPAFDLAGLEVPVVESEGERGVVKTRSLENVNELLKIMGPPWMRPGEEFLPAVLKSGNQPAAR